MEDQCEYVVTKIIDGVPKKFRCTSKIGKGIVRCKHVCGKHYRRLKADNLRRFDKNMDIPETTETIVKNIYADVACTEEITNG